MAVLHPPGTDAETLVAASPTEPATGTGFGAVIEEISAWLTRSADEVDASWTSDERDRVLHAIGRLNAQAGSGDADAFYAQQFLLARIYQLHTQIPDTKTAEGSIALHQVTRLLEDATIAAQDADIEPGMLDSLPAEPRPYLSWIKRTAKDHRVYKHPYYRDFIHNHATVADLRAYVIQESVVDGRFDDLLAMMQVGTNGAAKMEIANNFWDEMGNGDHAQVHTHLFNNIFKVFDVEAEEMERSLTANALLSGNLAVLLCRYRQFYAEAVGFLGMTEWLVPDRFVHVLHAWDRLGLPEHGVAYHRLHVTIDSQHAQGWFHNVVLPAADSAHMRRGIARGTLWRLNSSARYLDERTPTT
ncbi:MAG: iron-containing redox enzyme family protein [Jatrophihabitantaceae bacterium]